MSHIHRHNGERAELARHCPASSARALECFGFEADSRCAVGALSPSVFSPFRVAFARRPANSVLVAALGITFLVSWMFNHTSGSLITVFLYHFAFNFIGNATGIFGNPALAWLFTGICIVVDIMAILLDWVRFT
jgi:hypothetical protein